VWGMCVLEELPTRPRPEEVVGMPPVTTFYHVGFVCPVPTTRHMSCQERQVDCRLLA
jgi:hypothetical protein